MSGNGIDLGAIHQILLGIAQVQQDHGQQLAGLRTEMNDVRSQMHDVRSQMHDVRSQMHDMRSQMNDMRSQIGGLRQQVTEYHSSVLGHGILISELDQRVRRIEEHLGLPSVV